MAKQEVEATFLSLWLRDALLGKDVALKIMTHIRPVMLEYAQIADAYGYLVDRFAKGKSLRDLEVETDLTAILGPDWYRTVVLEAQQGGRIGEYVRAVLFNYRARRQALFLVDAAEKSAAVIGVNDEEANKIAQHAIAKLATFHTTDGDLDKPVTREEITERARLKLTKRGKSEGVEMPFDKIAEHTGNLLPGDTLAIAGYSNQGKSLLVANLWRKLVTKNVPVIAFPTEMGLQWHARGVAAHTRVPQMIAEREQWELATPEQIESYDFGLQELGQCPWELVDRPSITVDEIIARASVIRRKWEGQTVVVMVDHMHRLDYGRMEADKGVGPGTRQLRNWARSDDMGGIILCLLYQPRKPSDELELYKPVRGDQIRGVSEVWNEIDFLLAPYRKWVKTDPGSDTPWGTPSALYEKGFPVAMPPHKDGAKLDDEHAYVKIGKRRVGGEGPTVMLHIDSPSGCIYEIPRPRLSLVGVR